LIYLKWAKYIGFYYSEKKHGLFQGLLKEFLRERLKKPFGMYQKGNLDQSFNISPKRRMVQTADEGFCNRARKKE